MKKMKRILALVTTLAMILTMVAATGLTTFAADGETVTISVAQDSSYNGTENAAGRTYTWYKVFDASYTSNESTGGSYDNDGAPSAVTGGDGAVAYEASAAVAAKLGSWDATNKTWTKASGNLWFKLAPISGSEKYSVTWDNTATDADTVQAAARWLKENNVYDTSGNLTWSSTDKKWSAEVAKGYYLIVSDTGANLVAATTDVNVNEKNDYPPVDKTQADEDSAIQVDIVKSVAIGDVISYEVKVTIPKTAAVGNIIEVYDKPSKGLTYNNNVAVKENTGNATIADGTADTGEAWRKKITVTEGSQGKTVVFSFTMTVNNDALTDTDRENEAGLKYGNEYNSIPDKVKYTTYFTGINKIDGKTKENLEGVKFALKENGVAFNVTKTSDGYYIPGGESNEVVTEADGLIKIRGLDNDKTYTLTETETLDGYNMLDSDVTLILTEDTDDAFASTKVASWTDVENNTGTVLPSTGGIGTTIFYILGSALVIGCGIVLISRKRMQNK